MFSLRLRTPITAQASALRIRSIHVSALRSFPERSQMAGGDAAKLENEKQKNLADQQDPSPLKDAPRWNEALASESEAVVKADTSAKKTDPKDLQGETVEHVKKVHGH
ncbi:hypothetical protein FFLO_01396 [Filobasidium floriforme]|uniref:Uncharacterized protein n=1 Tax=Filobasidium floriforme TaxID=5210 RepID=A0A8K0JQ52_9TREE|nr:hypothetical protein FFLO_01396 [Filobasidium floriforme]